MYENGKESNNQTYSIGYVIVFKDISGALNRHDWKSENSSGQQEEIDRVLEQFPGINSH
jgi:hypothetical protein